MVNTGARRAPKTHNEGENFLMRELDEASDDYVMIPEKVQKTLLNSVIDACTAYQKHHENRELFEYNRGYLYGNFSFLRHSSSGIARAQLYTRLSEMRNANDPSEPERRLIQTLAHFLNDKDTHFNTHSLSTYLMDAIIEQKNLSITPNEKTGCYSLEDRDAVVQAMKNDIPQRAEINYWQR